MPQDAFTLRFLADELNTALAGAKVNKIAQPTADEVVLTLYAGGKTVRCVLSANASACRVSTESGERENPVVAPNFCMLLRKHLMGGTLDRVERVGEERILKLSFTNRNDFFETEQKELYAEVMGKYSNLILVAEGKILGSIKAYAFDETNKRPLLTGMRYELPPAQDKLSLEKGALTAYFSQFTGGDLGDYVFRGVRGFAFQTAAELAYRFRGAGTDGFRAQEAEAFADFLLAFPQGDYAPCVTYAEGKPTDFSVCPYRSGAGEPVPCASLLQAQARYYGERENAKRFYERKQRVLALVAHAEKRLNKRLAVIANKEFDCRDMEENRIKGELLTAASYRLPRGAERAELDNYYDPNGGTVTVSLDSRLSAAENAQAYFKRYRKEKRTLMAIAPQKAEVEEELRYLATVRAEIDLVERAEDFSLIETELAENGYRDKKPVAKGKKKEKKREYLLYRVDGFAIKAGRTNLENDALTAAARGGDLWLHAKQYHSSHVVIERGDRPFSEEAILRAAEICAYYSAGRTGAKIEIDYTLKKHVKKPAGAKSGFALYTDFQTIVVEPDQNEAFRAEK